MRGPVGQLTAPRGLRSFPGCCAARRIKLWRHSPMCNCTSWMRHLAQARNPYSLSWLWIPGSRKSAPRNDGRISIRDTSENGQRTTRLAQVICPSGGFLTGLSSLISDFPKNISVPTHPKSHLEFSHPTPQRGVGHRHERGEGCDGRGSILRATGSQGRSKDL